MKLDTILLFKNAVHLRNSVEKVKEIAMETLNVLEVLCVGGTIAIPQDFLRAILIVVRKVPPKT